MYTSLELFWNSLVNAPSSIVFYLEMKVDVEVGVHDIRSLFIPRIILNYLFYSKTDVSPATERGDRGECHIGFLSLTIRNPEEGVNKPPKRRFINTKIV